MIPDKILVRCHILFHKTDHKFVLLLCDALLLMYNTKKKKKSKIYTIPNLRRNFVKLKLEMRTVTAHFCHRIKKVFQDLNFLVVRDEGWINTLPRPICVSV